MSYREIPVDIVKKACEDYLERREQRIIKRREKLIDAEMSKDSWFNPAPKTREEAKERIIKSDCFNEWSMIGWSGHHWVIKVEDLLALCSVNGGSDSVFVDADIADILF